MARKKRVDPTAATPAAATMKTATIKPTKKPEKSTAAASVGVAFESRDIVKKKYQSKTKRAGIQFPVSRVLRSLRNGHYADKVFTGKNTRFHYRP